jgi:hypothetical protein
MQYELWIHLCANTSHYCESKELENGKPLLTNRTNFKEKNVREFLGIPIHFINKTNTYTFEYLKLLACALKINTEIIP